MPKPARRYCRSATCWADDTKFCNCWAKAAWARSTRPADRELDRFVALKVIRPELASNPVDPGAFQAGAAARAPGHAPQRDSHLRPRRSRGREVHHHGVHRGQRSAVPHPRKAEIRSRRSRRGDSTGLPGAGCGAQRGRDSPRSETAKHHAGPQRAESW